MHVAYKLQWFCRMGHDCIWGRFLTKGSLFYYIRSCSF
uniref:Uncharacterized protein n=1 Tax=Arundo donax TaxID=35708 RepID=A0A0A9FX44_ARUDO